MTLPLELQWRFTFTQFARETLYRFNATAHNGAGASPWSNTVEVTTPPKDV